MAKSKLTGTLRAFWDQEPVELLARNGEIILATTRDPQVYCPEAPITLVNVDASPDRRSARQLNAKRAARFSSPSREEGQILHEPALQLVQHYGQKLFANSGRAPRVRFIFEQSD